MSHNNMIHAGYLVIPCLQLENVNTEANLHVAGLPAITSFTGFVHWLQLNWLAREVESAEAEEMVFQGVAIIGHSLSLYEGQSKCPQALHGMAPTRPEEINPSIVQELKGDLGITLIIKVIQDEDGDEECVRGVFSKNNLKQLAARLLEMPIAGGRLVKPTAPFFVTSSKRLAEELRNLSYGWLLCNAKEHLDGKDDDSRDALDRLLDALAVTKGDDDTFHRQQPGWLIPVAIGYRLLEAPVARPGTRKQLPHAYAEPVISLAQWRYLPSLIHGANSCDLQGMGALWRHTWHPNHRLCVVDTEN